MDLYSYKLLMYLVTNLAPNLLLIYDKSHMIGAISHILEYYFLMITSSVVVTAFHYEICLTEVRWCLFKKKSYGAACLQSEMKYLQTLSFSLSEDHERISHYTIILSFSVWELSCK
jgi:hypothetical protein